MSDTDSKHPIQAQEIKNYVLYLKRFRNHIDEQNPVVQDTIKHLSDIQGLSNIKEFSDIGEDATNWIELLKNNYSFNTGLGVIKTTLNSEHHEQLQKQTQTWVTRFSDRLDSEVLVVTPSTDLSINKLLSGPSAYLDISDIEEYEDVTRDLQEACANLLTGAYTSSEFMSLRSVEGILRKWHKEEVDTEKKYNSWASAIDDLADQGNGKGPKELRLLDYLRERRNEVAHPDRHSTQRDAENTVRQSIDVVETLISELNDERANAQLED